VIGAHQHLAGKVIDGAGDALGQAAVVDEHEGGAVAAHQLQQARMNGAPDGWPRWPLRRRPARQRVDVVQP
jgi:hypothetical protein